MRKLQDLEIPVRFKKENINAGPMESELFLTILNSMAEGEPASISGNAKRSVKRRFRNGTYKLGYTPYGYDWDGKNMIISPDQAAVVKRTFADTLPGKSTNAIADELDAEKVPSKKNTNWTSSTIRGILASEKYIGDVIFQKTYTDENFSRRTNYGEVDQYMALDHHEAIISHSDSDAANALVNQRAAERDTEKGGNKYQQRYAFSGKIICGECGDTFKRGIHSCITYKYVAWACDTHPKNKESCHMRYVRDDEIETAFTTMLSKFTYGYRLILTPYLKVLENSSSDEAIHRIQHLEQLIAQNSEQREALTKLMAQGYINQILYNQETNELLLQAETHRSDIKAVTTGMTGDVAKVTETRLLLHFVSHTDMLIAYSEELFENCADHIEVVSRNEIRFAMKCGLIFTERIGDQMGHTPFDCKIENGIAIIDQPATDKLRQPYKNYLSDMSLLKAASATGIKAYHGIAKRLMETAHYLRDSFYPAIIDKGTYQEAQEEHKRRATALGQSNKQTQTRKLQIPTRFHMGEVIALYDSPVKQAKHLYSLIESESK